MSAGKNTFEEPNYYNSAAYREQQEAAKADAASKAQYTTTARWFREETQDEFEKNTAGQKPKEPHKEYIDNQTVERATIRKMITDRDNAFKALQKSVPPQIGKMFKIGEEEPTIVQVRVRDKETNEIRYVRLRHLSTTVLGRMMHVAEDGSKSVINFYIANFTPGNVDPKSLALEQIPAQHDGVQNQAITYMVGRKLNPDGSLGEVNPRFTTPDGKAIMTRDLSVIQEKMIEIGKNNLAYIRARDAAKAKAAAAPSETSQILQSEKDRIRAVQAQLQAREQAARQQQPEQDVGRSYGR